jgi:2-isopropylmalate synthase
MYSQGIDPCLDIHDINAIRTIYERCTRLDVPIRHPYAGELVFTAFSGSHQDAINKGMTAQDPTPGALWAVPYLPIDPMDIGRTYEAIIRINSQSGKGGVAYLMENDFGFQLPKQMRIEFGKIINDIADTRGEEIPSAGIYQIFEQEYLKRFTPFKLEDFHTEQLVEHTENERVACIARILVNGQRHEIKGRGNGPIDAFVNALNQSKLANFTLLSYAEHSLSKGAAAKAVAYIQIQTESAKTLYGAAVETDIERASIKAVLSAINRAC